MEKHNSGDGPVLHHIEADDGDTQVQTRSETNEDILELRKFIMDMMHTEMEFVERIKQNEDSIATVNSRIEELKTSVKTEQRRNKTIQARLHSSVEDLHALEEKEIVLNAKYRQFRDVVEAHGLESRSLKSQHQRLRDQMRISEEQENANKLRTRSFISSSEEWRSRSSLVLKEMDRGEQFDMLRSELQKIRAKRRYIEQHTEQLEHDLHDTNAIHEEFKGQLETSRLDLSEQSAVLAAVNQDCSRRRTYLLEEVHQLRLYHEQSNKKLKAKQKKYRVKMRAEIVTLRKRVAFLTTELENHEMNAEDILSSIAPFRDQREQLEARRAALDAEATQIEERIVCAQQDIESFDSCKEKFNIREMKANLAQKNDEVDQAVRALKAKKDELAQLQEDDQKLRNELDNLGRLIEEASLGDVDEEFAQLTTTREELRARYNSLVEKEGIAKDRCQRLNSSIQSLQKLQKCLKSATCKMQKEFRKLSNHRDQAAEKLEKEQTLLATVEEADQCVKRFNEELNTIRGGHAEELDSLEQELCKREEVWKRQCLEEETRLKTELQNWNAKVAALQDERRAR